MGKVRMFAIQFEGPANEMPVFYPGQQIQGTVLLELAEPMKMRGIHVKLKGKSRVRWSEQHGSGKHRHTVVYHSNERYIDYVTTLFGKQQGDTEGDNPVMAPGYYTFPFGFTLPTELPSSFESQYGRIRYFVSAVIDKPWKMDHKTKRPFTIIAQLDLNMMPQTKMGVSDSDEKTICCLCCASEPIVAQLWLERSGFVPGETIFASGSVQNPTSRDIISTKFKLVQQVACHAGGKTRNQISTVVKTEPTGFGDHARLDYPQVQLQVPAVPASGLRGCQIIDVTYYIQMVVDPSGTPLDLDVDFPVTIGTIPLVDSYWYYMQKIAPSAATPTVPAELPPPSYAELYNKSEMSTGDEDAKKANVYGESNWTPMYTYYTYGPQSAPPM